MMTADEILGLVQKAPEPRTTERPWYISLMLGVAGWFAGLLLLIFAGALFRPDKAPGAIALGAVLVAAAFGLFKVDRNGTFVSQLALALSIAGQVLLLFGLHEGFFKGLGGSTSITSIAFVALVIQLALIPIMPSHLHRTMSTLFASVAWAVFVRYALWDRPMFFDWNRSEKHVGPSFVMALLGWLAAWGPAAGALYMLIRKEPAWMAAGRHEVARPVATGLIVGLAFGTILSQPFESLAFLGAGSVRENWLAIWPLLSALASLGALLAAFALGARGLMGICVLAALLHMSHFYYAMGTSLLLKSLMMMVMGAGCLVAAWKLRHATLPGRPRQAR